MLFRAIALSLALLIGIGAIVPLATMEAEAGPKKVRKYKHKKKRYKKYSKGWWRQYRARQRRRRALAARRRALRLRQVRLARAAKLTGPAAQSAAIKNVAKRSDDSTALLPSGAEAPRGWKRSSTGSGELVFRVDDATGSQVGSAAISVVGPAMGETVIRPRNAALAGVPTASLRREVINRMIRENGWVVNDYQKEVAGRSVYVVVAQSQSGARVQSRMFYFTEVDGRIYSLATNSGADEAARLAEESEKVLNSLQRQPRPAQQAARQE